MKARDSQTGTFKDVYVKALDSMPVGTQIEYTGDTIPTGWEEVNDYSTDEIDTGKKWIDGKPIYRKVIDLGSNITISGGTWRENVATISNCKMITNASASVVSGATSVIRATFDNSSRISIMNPFSNFDIIIRYIVLEYTKTTD